MPSSPHRSARRSRPSARDHANGKASLVLMGVLLMFTMGLWTLVDSLPVAMAIAGVLAVTLAAMLPRP